MTRNDSHKPLRLTVFAFDIPYPAHRGGRADIWRRLVALRTLNCSLQLVCWQNAENAPPTQDDLAAMRHIVDDLSIFPLRQGRLEPIKRFAMVAFRPSHVLARRVSDDQSARLIDSIRSFNPDAVWLEGPYPGLLAECAAMALDIPYFYRSHNIEHLYMARQARAAKVLRRKVAWAIACIGLKRYETRLMRNAKHVFDISADDILYWQALGIDRISNLPPLPESAIRNRANDVAKVKSRDVVFLGNLSTPNNVRGVEFLLTEVVPILLQSMPGTRITIAGSRPTKDVQRLVASAPSTELLEDVPDAMAIFESARVLVNPVRTGSGVMVKILDMLMTDAPIVSASQGACGLPAIVRAQMVIADDAHAFARAIEQALSNPSVDLAYRCAARQTFSIARLEHLRNDLRQMIAA